MAKSKKELIIKNEYLSWLFRPEKSTIVRFNIRNLGNIKKRRQVSCSVQNGEINGLQFKRSFCAIYVIHVMQI